jgi:PAS domain S-box-containing protein
MSNSATQPDPATDPKLMNEELSKANLELQRKVEELSRANQELVNLVHSHQQSESVLRASEERFRVMADSAPVLIWTSNREGLRTFFNQSWLELTGRSLEQELGEGWLDAMQQEDREHFLPLVRFAYQSHQPYATEYRLRRASGEYRWVMENAAPHFEEGEFAGYIGSCTDITERKYSELNQQFLVEIGAETRRLTDPDEIAKTVTSAIGNYLAVDSCVLSEVDVDADRGTILCKWEPQGLSLDLPYVLSASSTPEMRAEAMQGRMLVAHDTRQDPRTRGGPYSAGEVGAFLFIPSLHEGRWVAYFGVYTRSPRRWRNDEVALLQSAAARVWPAIEKARAEVAVRASAEQLRVITDAMPGLISSVDAQERYQFVNAAYERWFGLPRVGILGRSVCELLPADAYATIKPYVAAALAGQTVTFENEINYMDGQKTVLTTYVPYRKPDGMVSGFYALITDITARKRAEEALRLSEERLRLATEAGRIGIFDYDIRTGQAEFSPIYREVTQYGPDEPLTMEAWLTHVHPDDRQLVASTQKRAREEGTSYQYEYRVIWPDGTLHWVEVSSQVSKDAQGQASRVTGTMRDISERKQTEERLRYLSEISQVLASSLDYATTLQRVADLTVPRLGDWCAIDIPAADGSLELVAVAHVDPAKAAWARELRQRFPPDPNAPGGVYRVLHSGESEFYPEISEEGLLARAKSDEHRTIIKNLAIRSALIVPLKVRDQTLAALTLVWSESSYRYSRADLHFAEEVAQHAAVALDNARLYSDARAAEAELRLLNAELEQRVAERTEELARSNHDLDQFAYAASHDLKAPLRAIDNLATWVSEDAEPALSTLSQEHLDKLRRRVKRMERLLDDLLAYARAGRIHHPLEVVETGALVQDIIETLMPPPGFTITHADPMPTLITERVPLEMRNLIGNAIKHHDRPDGKVEIDARDLGTHVEFSVIDNGPGIAEQFHSRIFELFQTLRPSNQIEANGMGLAIVKKLVEQYGGTVQVISDNDRGATFRFTWLNSKPVPK